VRIVNPEIFCGCSHGGKDGIKKYRIQAEFELIIRILREVALGLAGQHQAQENEQTV